MKMYCSGAMLVPHVGYAGSGIREGSASNNQVIETQTNCSRSPTLREWHTDLEWGWEVHMAQHPVFPCCLAGWLTSRLIKSRTEKRPCFSSVVLHSLPLADMHPNIPTHVCTCTHMQAHVHTHIYAHTCFSFLSLSSFPTASVKNRVTISQVSSSHS